METTVSKTWKPITAGIFDLLSSPFVLSQALGGALQGHLVIGQIAMWVFTILGITAIVGGIFAIRRKIWGLALAGSICASISLFTWYLGIAAIVLTLLAKKEFK